MEQIITDLIEYGFAAVALFMLYNIAYNHLNNIENLLLEIREILDTKL